MHFRGFTADEARAFADRWLPAWTGNDPDRLAAFYAPDAFYSDPAVPAGIEGREQLAAYFRKLLARYPDWVWTHRGSLPITDGFLNFWHATLPVGGQVLEIDGVCTVQVRDGLIYSNQVFFDRSRLLPALGAPRLVEARRLDGGGGDRRQQGWERSDVMNRVIHFEIHAGDPERAVRFYRDVFGWTLKEWVVPGVEVPAENRYWLVMTGPDGEPGINGGLLIRRGPPPTDGQPVNAYVCTIGVASVDETLERAVAAGGTVALPKMPIKGLGWLAYCKDTEGNIFGMMQDDKSAA